MAEIQNFRIGYTTAHTRGVAGSTPVPAMENESPKVRQKHEFSGIFLPF